MLFIPLYYSIFTLLAYAASFSPVAFTRPVFAALHLVTIMLSVLWFLWNFGDWRFIRIIRAIRSIRIIQLVQFLLPIIPSLLLFAILYSGFHGYITIPHNIDAGNHLYLVRQILDTESIRFQDVYQGLNNPQWYPLALHTFIASAMSLLNTTDYLGFVFPFMWFIGALYPLAIYYFSTSVLTPNPKTSNQQTRKTANTIGKEALFRTIRSIRAIRIIPLLASLASLTFFMFPYNVWSWGGFSMITGMVLFWFTLGIFYRLLHHPSASTLASCFVLLASLFLTHPSEVFSFIILAMLIMLFHHKLSLQLVKKRARLIFTLALASSLILLPTLINSSRLATGARAESINHIHYDLADSLEILQDFHFTVNQNYIFTALWLMGLYLFIKKRRYLHLVAIQAAIITAFFLVNSTTLLDPLYTATYPWLETERIFYLIEGFRALTIALALAYALHHLSKQFKSPFILHASYFILLSIPFLLVLRQNRANLRFILNSYAPVTAADLKILTQNQNRCRNYLATPAEDVARYIPYLFPGTNTVFDGLYTILPDYQARLDLLTQANTFDSHSTIQPSNHLNYDCLFIGGHSLTDKIPLLILPQVAANPDLELLDYLDGSAIFVPTTSGESSSRRGPPNERPQARLTETPRGLPADWRDVDWGKATNLTLTNLPLTLEASNTAQLKLFIVGDVSDEGRSEEGYSYRAVNTRLEIWTKAPVDTLTLIGRSAHNAAQPCTYVANADAPQEFTFSPEPKRIVISDLGFKVAQNKIVFSCTPPVDAPAFVFTQIIME